ncbi:MAG: acyl-CoA dehydrogenase family protein [Marmoricola sp.]
MLAPVAEHADLRKVMRDILETRAGHEQVRESAQSEPGFSRELWSLLNAEMSVGILAVPEPRGGLGFGIAELAVVFEEAGRALLPEPLLVSATLGVRAVLAAPAGSVPDEVIAGVLDGSFVATIAIAPQADADLEVGGVDGALTISGRIGRVLLGGAVDVVVVRAGPERGESLYLVDLRGDGTCRRTPLESLDHTRRLARVDLAATPAYLVAGPEAATRVSADLENLSRTVLAAEHVGMIDALLEMTRTYLGQRHQFGRALASFQVIKHRLADMLVDLERARSAAMYAAAAFDLDPATAGLSSAVAGATCTDAVIRVAHEAVQLHGGIGFTWEHPAHYYVRRALGDEALFGSARADRVAIADLLGI